MRFGKKSRGSAMPGIAEEVSDDTEALECKCHKNGLPLLTALTDDPVEILIMRLMRSFMTGYTSGNIMHWDRAMPLAEDTMGVEVAPLFHGHVLALVRAVRFERMVDFHFQGAFCHGISEDEVDFLTLLQATRHGEEEIVNLLAARFARNPDTSGIRFTMRAVVDLIRRVSICRSPTGQGFEAEPTNTTRH